jgi:phage replication initiation protein
VRRQSTNLYAEASACSTQARGVKAQIYGTSKARGADGERTASAAALPARIAVGARERGLVPHFAHVTDAYSPAINNMAENLSVELESRWNSVSDEHLGHVELILTTSGEVKTMLVRRPAKKQVCIIDWINFSVAEQTWCNTAREQLVSDDQFVTEASRQLEKIFGFGVTEKCKSGKNFFKESWVLGDGMGFVCFGGNKSKMGIIISGHGCLHALPGWEVRLYEFLTKVAVDPKISRVDLAHDDFDGSYLSVDWAYEQWKTNQFSRKVGGRPPEIQRLGNWDRPSGRGRTLTVGMRSSSQFVRFYEKGKKEGDKESNWCRCEIEFKNTNTIIFPEVLLNPSQFFKGAYPCMSYFEKFGEVDAAARFEVKQRAAQITIEASEKWMSVQVGRYLRVFRELYGDKDVLDRLCCPDDDYWPKRLKRLTDSATSGSVPIHKQEPMRVPDFIQFITTVPSFGLNGEHGFA